MEKITKLNKKLEKKYKREARREIQRHFQTLEYGYFITEFVKARPKWIPMFIWLKLVKLVVKKNGDAKVN